MAALKLRFQKLSAWIKGLSKFRFTKKESEQSSKRSFDLKKILILGSLIVFVFVIVTLFLPTEHDVKFREVADNNQSATVSSPDTQNNHGHSSGINLWESQKNPSTQAASQINYNTPMVVTAGSGNAKLQLSAGALLRIQIVDKFIASQEATPIMAKIIEEAITESGLSIQVGSLLYGDAMYDKPSGRAKIQFKQISMPNGTIRSFLADVINQQPTSKTSDGSPLILRTAISPRATLYLLFLTGIRERLSELDSQRKSSLYSDGYQYNCEIWILN